MHIELTKGSRRWYWKLIAANGQTILVSQHYYSAWNAKRAATKLAEANGYPLEVQ